MRRHPQRGGFPEHERVRTRHAARVPDPVEYVADLLVQNCGVLSTAQLRRVGCGRAMTDHLVSRGALTRLRWGWYRGPLADDDVLAAVKAGGVLSCISALKKQGIWVPITDVVHVRFTEYRSQHPRSARVKNCRPYDGSKKSVQSVDRPWTALACAMWCLDEESCVAVLDSALNHRVITEAELWDLVRDHPSYLRRRVELCDPRCESGTETLVRLRLQARRVRVVPQAVISGVGRVDLLVGDRLVIEVDSRAHHTGEHNYASDRLRDRKLVRLGYIVVRLTWEQVMFGWAEVETDLMALIRRDRHRGRPSSS